MFIFNVHRHSVNGYRYFTHDDRSQKIIPRVKRGWRNSCSRDEVSFRFVKLIYADEKSRVLVKKLLKSTLRHPQRHGGGGGGGASPPCFAYRTCPGWNDKTLKRRIIVSDRDKSSRRVPLALSLSLSLSARRSRRRCLRSEIPITSRKVGVARGRQGEIFSSRRQKERAAAGTSVAALEPENLVN